MQGLHAALELHLVDGVDAADRRHELLSRAVKEGVKALGLDLFGEGLELNWTVTAISAPEGFDADAISEPAVTVGDDRFARPDNASRLNSGGARRNSGSVQGDTRNRRSVWSIPSQPFTEAHFATMPPALADLCIRAGCPEHGWVLDPFGGAGTTGLVADRLQRHAILIELNPEYAGMAGDRFRGDAPLFASVE
jgi:hypothetical protein